MGSRGSGATSIATEILSTTSNEISTKKMQPSGIKKLLHKTFLDEAFVFPGEDEIEVVMTAARGVADQKGFLTMQV